MTEFRSCIFSVNSTEVNPKDSVLFGALYWKGMMLLCPIIGGGNRHPLVKVGSSGFSTISSQFPICY